MVSLSFLFSYVQHLLSTEKGSMQDEDLRKTVEEKIMEIDSDKFFCPETK